MLFDIIFRRAVDDRELAATVAAALSIPTAQVRIIHDIAEMAEDVSAAVTLLTWSLSGDFSTFAEWFNGGNGDEIDMARRLTKLLNTDALISDDTLDPFLMLRVRANGALERVSLDSEREDEYVVLEVVETLPTDWRPGQLTSG